jgi:DNA-binding NtrC family response regulator
MRARTLGETTVPTNKTVLVVDDDDLVLESILLLLAKAEGLEAIPARGSADATMHLKGPRPIDVIVADIVLAGPVSGLDVCRRAIDHRPDIAIVVITADTEIHRSDIADRGVFLRKPFGADALLVAIRQSMDQIPTAERDSR